MTSITGTSCDDDSSGDDGGLSGGSDRLPFYSKRISLSKEDEEEDLTRKYISPPKWAQDSNITSRLSEDSEEDSDQKSNSSDDNALREPTSIWSHAASKNNFTYNSSPKKKKKSEGKKSKKLKRNHQTSHESDETLSKKKKKNHSYEVKYTSPSNSTYANKAYEGFSYGAGEGFDKKRNAQSSSEEDEERPGFGSSMQSLDSSMLHWSPTKQDIPSFKDEVIKKKRSLSSSSSGDEANYKKTKKQTNSTMPSATSLDVPLHYNKGTRIMERAMGYKAGEGLGKHSQGRVDPVELSKQKGRFGLGHTVPEINWDSVDYDPSKEVIKLNEEISMLNGNMLDRLDIEVLRGWKQEGTKNLDISTMTDFCDPEILKGVLQSKTVFESLKNLNPLKARTRANPFETIGSGIFLNRAAMKMANIDCAFDFMFTNPLTEDGQPVVGRRELIYFADVCAGPGGFSEYVLWRKKWRAKGFGFTLKGENDFKLSDFLSGPCETFEAYYGVRDDGNIFYPENINSFRDFVLNATNGEGVHFMMADGGFSVAGKENIQELLSKQLYLTQFLVALSIVRTGGHFVCKVFDLFSPFSVGLIYLMYRAFKHICIFKPNTSRPANSERYIICKWKRDDCDSIRQYMFELNETLNELGSSSKTDVNYCVPMLELQSDSHFFEYIFDSNNKLGERQILSLMKIAVFCKNEKLIENKQPELRDKSLALWKVPNKFRKMDRATADEAFKKILPRVDKGLLSKGGIKLTVENMESSLQKIYDWNCIVLGNDEGLTFYLGLGRSKIFRWSGSRWVQEPNPNFELSPGTLVYGEMVTELIGEARSQRKQISLHIFDAISLGYEEIIAHRHYNERYALCSLYETSLRKYSPCSGSPVRVIPAIPLEKVNLIFERLTYRLSKGSNNQLVVEGDGYSYLPKGILFFKTTKKPWSRTISKGTRKYYYHCEGQESKYENDQPPEANATAMDSIEDQRVWRWQNGVGILNEKPKPDVIHKDNLIKFVRKSLIL